MYKILVSIVSIFSLSQCTTTSTASTDIEGVVVMVGSAPAARPILEPNGPKSQVEICSGSEQDYLRRFGGTIVKASGEWGSNKNSKEKCFQIKSFQVTQLIKGRPALTGALSKSKDGSSTTFQTSDGKTMQLEQPSKGLLDLVGKKVIVDLLASQTTSTKVPGEQLWKVVSYMEFPER